MTEFDDADVPDFDDPSYAEIRALLAGAAVTEPMPAEVAAGLDDVLAELVAQRAADADADTDTDTDNRVVPLRRARRARRLLVAAAAVVLVGAGGVGVSQVLQDSNRSSDSTASGATDRDLADEAPAPAAGVPEIASGDALGGTGTWDGQTNLERAYKNLDLRANQNFTRGQFSHQVNGLAAQTNGLGSFFDTDIPDAGVPTGPAPSDQGSSSVKQPGGRAVDPQCPGPPATDGVVLVAITFEGHPALMALHPVVDGSRYIAAWSCDGHRLLAYTSVPG